MKEEENENEKFTEKTNVNGNNLYLHEYVDLCRMWKYR